MTRASGFILVYPNPMADLLGLSLVAGVAIWQWHTNPKTLKAEEMAMNP
jgi:hypothetical protein